MLNSAAVERINLQAFANEQGVEVDAQGVVTGRLFRLDDWLREQLASLLAAGSRLLGYLEADLLGGCALGSG